MGMFPFFTDEDSDNLDLEDAIVDTEDEEKPRLAVAGRRGESHAVHDVVEVGGADGLGGELACGETGE